MLKTLLALFRALLSGLTGRLCYVEIEIPGIAAADAFDANDTVGVVFPFPAPKWGTIETAKLIDRDDDTLALTVHIYNAVFVGTASDAAYSIAATYASSWVTNITFDAPIVDEGEFKVSEKQGATDYIAREGRLWGLCSTTGTPNIAAGAMPLLQLGIRPRLPWSN